MSLTTRRLLVRPTMRVTAGLEKLRVFSKKQHVIVSDLGLIEHVAVADVDTDLMLVLSIADVRSHGASPVLALGLIVIWHARLGLP